MKRNAMTERVTVFGKAKRAGGGCETGASKDTVKITSEQSGPKEQTAG